MRTWVLLFCLMPLGAAERAAYDSGGRLTAMMQDGEDLDIRGQLVVVLPSGKRLPVQMHLEHSPIRREGHCSG